MVFDYDAYWRNICSVPISIIVWFSLLLLIQIVFLIYVVVNKKMDIIKQLVFVLLFIITGFLCTRDSITDLKNGGIYLLEEKENDAIIETGIIESITEPSKLHPNFKSTRKNGGADIIINGEIYLAVDSGDFDVGDRVTITYLPKSKVILSIYPVDE